jgi:hypothetical protein
MTAQPRIPSKSRTDRRDDVDRAIKRQPFLEIAGHDHRVPLRIRRRELAPSLAPTGDQAATEARGVPLETELLDRPLDLVDICLGDAWNQQVLRGGQRATGCLGPRRARGNWRSR